MVNKCDLIPMNKVYEINNVLILGIKDQIHLFIIDTMTGYPRLLSSSHLAIIRQAIPNRTTLLFDRPMPGSYVDDCSYSAVYGDYGYQDLWIEEKIYNDLFKPTNKLSTKLENSDLNIIGALLKTMLATSTGGQKISIFDSQAKIIDYLTSNFQNVTGISKSHLEGKFSKANQSIKSSSIP